MDIATMAHSLEARSPFLDQTVLEFSATLPDSWKVHGFTTKYILRKTFDDLLPPEITRRKKQGFGIPLGTWFRNEWKDYFRETVLSDRAIKRGYFDRAALSQLFTEHTEGKRDHGYCLWALLMLELWHREVYDA
jgi:asparagine synthase (glutamine-hydrolysing)